MLSGKFPAEWCFLIKLGPQVSLFPVPIFGVNRRMPGDRNLLSPNASLVIPTCVLRFEVSGLHRRTPVRPVLLTCQTGTHRSDRSGAAASPSSVLRSWLGGSTKEPSGFLANHWKPANSM
jgi:hypothetical protein